MTGSRDIRWARMGPCDPHEPPDPEARCGDRVRELSSARTKLRRAQDHLESLDREIREWVAGDACSVRIQSDPIGTVHELVVTIHDAPDLERWGCLVGDCAHNLRSALDHLIWTISGTKPLERCEFPIFKQPVRRRAVGLEYGFRSKIEGVTEKPIRDLIEECQPCNAKGVPPERAVLWMLHRIDIVDRHKMLVPALLENLEPTRMAIRIAPAMSPPEIIKNAAPIRDGDTLLTLLTEDSVEHIEADLSAPLRVGIAVQELDIDLGTRFGPIPALLAEASVAVETIIAEVERKLP